MPICLSDLAGESRTFALPYGDDASISITYDPTAITPEAEALLLKAEERGAGFGPAIAEVLAGFLISWDVMDAKGVPVEPTRDNLLHIRTAFLMRVLNGIYEDISPKKTPSTASRSGSPTPMPRASSQKKG